LRRNHEDLANEVSLTLSTDEDRATGCEAAGWLCSRQTDPSFKTASWMWCRRLHSLS